MKRLPPFRLAWAHFRADLADFLIFELLFGLVSLALFAPLVAWSVDHLFALTGRLVWSNEEILGYALSPAGLLLIFVWLLLLVTLVFLETAGLVAITGRNATPLGAVRQLHRHVLPLARNAAWQIGGYAAVVLVLGAGVALVWTVFLSDTDIYYYLNVRPAEFLWAVSLAAVLTLGAVGAGLFLFLSWILAIPLVMGGESGDRATLVGSRRLLTGNRVRLGVTLAVWNLAVFVVGGAVIFGLELAYRGVFAVFPHTVWVLGPATLVLLASVVGVLALVHLISFSVSVIYVVQVLHSLAPERKQDPLRDSAASGMRMAVGATILTALIVAGFAFAEILDDAGPDRPITVMAHRGSSLKAPENSLSAIRLAMEEGADMVEIDVQETADGVVVLLHDSDLARIAGVRRGIHEMTLAEIRELDAGSWFSEDFAGERIPTLREALELGWPTVGFNVELKYAGHDRELAASVIRILDESGCTECVISSLNQGAVEEVRRLAPDRRVGLIVGQSLGNLMRVDADFFAVRTGLASRDLIYGSRRRGREVIVWTVNDPVDMARMAALGVDGIMTDNPALLRTVMEQRAELSRAERVAFSVRAWLSR